MLLVEKALLMASLLMALRLCVDGLRHSFRDRLRAVDAPIEMIDRLGGWSLKSVGQSYGDGYQLEQMHLTMKMLRSD